MTFFLRLAIHDFFSCDFPSMTFYPSTFHPWLFSCDFFPYIRDRYLVLGDRYYFVKNHSDSTKKFSETDIINMLEFLINNIFVMFGGGVFQQTVGIPMGTNCAPLPSDLFLYSYEADLIQWPLNKNEKKLAQSFNFTFRYNDGVLSLNNSRFWWFRW